MIGRALCLNCFFALEQMPYLSDDQVEAFDQESVQCLNCTWCKDNVTGLQWMDAECCCTSAHFVHCQ